jgi:glucokinase
MTKRVAIGIDIGGTKIAAGLIADDGVILAQATETTATGQKQQLEQTLRLAETMQHKARALGLRPVGLGLGVAELVSLAGEVFSDHRIKWRGVSLSSYFSAFGPVTVEADVRAAALAEAQFGAARGKAHVLYVTIGTGISAVLIIDGEPYRGARGGALVVANQNLSSGSLDGQPGALEDWAGGYGLAKSYGVERAETVLAAADGGELRALNLVRKATTAVGELIAVLAGALDPELIVLGGGLGAAQNIYTSQLQQAFHKARWDGDAHRLHIVPANLGANAGLIGAGLCALLRASFSQPKLILAQARI